MNKKNICFSCNLEINEYKSHCGNCFVSYCKNCLEYTIKEINALNNEGEFKKIDLEKLE